MSNFKLNIIIFIIILFNLPITNNDILVNNTFKKIETKEEINILPLNNYTNKKENNVIGKLIIEKIKINNNLYKLNSKENNIEENITILKGSIPPDKENSIIFIAAHSGIGKIAYFNNLKYLNNGDLIILNYKNKTYKYKVINKYEIIKDGDIEIIKEDKNQLILTTCSTTNKNNQLIISAILE